MAGDAHVHPGLTADHKHTDQYLANTEDRLFKHVVWPHPNYS